MSENTPSPLDLDALGSQESTDANRWPRTHVYIMGAGRSGTTLLSVMLASHPAVRLSGELLDLPEHWKRNRRCTCRLHLQACEAWAPAAGTFGNHGSPLVDAAIAEFASVERHRNALLFILNPNKVPGRYVALQDALLGALARDTMLVDASKYLARAIALTRLRQCRFRYIYIVRDCRGVVFSFSKQGVQRPKGTLSAVLYYLGVNLAAELALHTRLSGHAIKLRYEDLVANPEGELVRIGQFLDLDTSSISERIRSGDALSARHMVSGNRAGFQGPLKVRHDDEWRAHYGLLRRLLLYVCCLPLQLMNRYRP